MRRLDALLRAYCPEGVECVPLWSVTIWNKKFNSVDRSKQPKGINGRYSPRWLLSGLTDLRLTFLQLPVNVLSRVEYAHNGYGFAFVPQNIENEKIVYRHDAQVSAFPRFSVVYAETFRHVIQR